MKMLGNINKLNGDENSIENENELTRVD